MKEDQRITSLVIFISQSLYALHVESEPFKYYGWILCALARFGLFYPTSRLTLYNSGASSPPRILPIFTNIGITGAVHPSWTW